MPPGKGPTDSQGGRQEEVERTNDRRKEDGEITIDRKRGVENGGGVREITVESSDRKKEKKTGNEESRSERFLC